MSRLRVESIKNPSGNDLVSYSAATTSVIARIQFLVQFYDGIRPISYEK